MFLKAYIIEYTLLLLIAKHTELSMLLHAALNMEQETRYAVESRKTFLA